MVIQTDVHFEGLSCKLRFKTQQCLFNKSLQQML